MQFVKTTQPYDMKDCINVRPKADEKPA